MWSAAIFLLIHVPSGCAIGAQRKTAPGPFNPCYAEMFSAERTIFAELYCGERLRKGVGTRSHISFLVRSVVLARADEVIV
jgi:hypothetical protein